MIFAVKGKSEQKAQAVPPGLFLWGLKMGNMGMRFKKDLKLIN